MMKNIICFCLSLLFLGVLTVNAQEGKIDKADKKFDQYAFVDARKIYLEVAEKGYKSADLFQKIADSYYFNAKYVEAEVWYNKLVSNYAEEIKPEYYFRFAQTLRALKSYDRADEMMAKFNEVNSDDLRAELFTEEPNYLSNIDYKKSKYTIEDIRSINSRYSDFAPTEYEGKLIFASSRDTGGATKKIHKWNNEPFLDLYESKVGSSSGSYTKPKAFSRELNSKFHESTTAFTKDGNTVYFTRNNFNKGNYRKSKNGTNKLKIYKSKKANGKWSTPVEMPFNSDEYSTAHPTLNADDSKLYFASDMPGTVGLSDIWVATVNETDSVGTPINLGRPINTEGRETFPFMSSKGVLYFGSDGHPGFGGLDVFATTPRTNSSEKEVISNIGEPINSSFDDFTFILNEDTQVGYFASNRKRGMGSDDIYRFLKEEIPCDIKLVGVVTDKDSGNPIPEATVQLIDSEGTVIEAVQATAAGAYAFEATCVTQYVIRASKEEYSTAEAITTTPDVTGTLTNDLVLSLLQKPINVGDDLAKVLELNPIYFDFDRFNIRPDAALELEKVIAVMREYPTMVLDARSHTDSRGKDSYNLSLSDKRAKSTVAYIIEQGISSSRITGQGYGEKQPVNTCSNGVKCSEEEHQLNRRSEFIVISN
ncbi:flagellar motor protein MotB [Dokdonia sp. Dokd-P16]|uniref:OmpA family protein n=1 Tax=Dokdonia sp. Dokd-P16 TaxID=2173169 RepID=UPI000D545A90|nr:OmpA family protein [Dokdonia sp. Dokd-P16]AWH73517.1 flagellar motor protein MotB [Dokdonia sp. Dokd-P16]